MLGFRWDDLEAAILQLSSDEASIRFESSSGYDGGVRGGTSHSHAVTITKRQLLLLRETGTVTVESEPAQGHRHFFTFISEENCLASVAPIAPEPSPSSALPSSSATPAAGSSPAPDPFGAVPGSDSSPSPAFTPPGPGVAGGPGPTVSPTPTGPRRPPLPVPSVAPPIAPPRPLPRCPTPFPPWPFPCDPG